MPMYDYRCPNGHEFEDMNTIANREKAECFHCGAMADQVLVNAPRLDPNMDTPGARMTFRRKAEERGRGKDMWAGNREVTEESTVKDAYDVRKALGETPIITNG